jgi:hypothetical protein
VSGEFSVVLIVVIDTGIDAGDSTSMGMDVGTEQANRLAANIHVTIIGISGTVDFSPTSMPFCAFNLP